MTATPSGGGAGPSGAQKGGASSGASQGGAATGASQGGAATAGASQAGAAPDGKQSAGAAAKGAQAGASAARGEKQAGAVAQGEIEFYAKVAQAQAQVSAGVEVRDMRGSTADASGSAGAAKGGGNADAELARIRQALSQEIASGKAEVERDGARIVIRLAEQGSFRSGSADLQQGFMQVLGQVGKTIAQSPGRIFIEGHTDNVPVVFNERFRSNWDLSAARSGAVADYMAASAGVPANRMSVSGFADTRPLDSNDSATGRGRNRRIEVIVDGAAN
jgi:chemotaxis protein MotB